MSHQLLCSATCPTSFLGGIKRFCSMQQQAKHLLTLSATQHTCEWRGLTLNRLWHACRAWQFSVVCLHLTSCVALQNVQQSSLDGKRPLQWIAEQTDKYSGADLHELATEAARHSVRSTTSLLSGLRYQVLWFLLNVFVLAVRTKAQSLRCHDS